MKREMSIGILPKGRVITILDCRVNQKSIYLKFKFRNEIKVTEHESFNCR